MRHKSYAVIWLISLTCCALGSTLSQAQPASTVPAGVPKLVKNGKATQLMVDGKPFLIVGGELNNSTSSSTAYRQPIWQLVTDLHFNTVLTPLSWDLIEPTEGQFDFRLVDSLIVGARQHDEHLVFLWLASWKNGMSSYMPLWVKANYKKYPRIKIKDTRTMEVLTTLSEANAQTSIRCF